VAKVVDIKRSSSGNDAVWDVSLELEEAQSGFGSEMSYNNISVDEIAEMRARFILFNQKPKMPSGSFQDSLNSRMLETFVYGISTQVKVEGSVLPSLWKGLNGDVAKFLPLARLWSVFHLITSNTVEHVLDLRLGPIKSGILLVYFRGRRKKVYSNIEPPIIEFEGECDLNSEEPKE
jgi:hypothetical protein